MVSRTTTKRKSQRSRLSRSQISQELRTQRTLARERKTIRRQSHRQYKEVSFKAPGRADLYINRKSRVLGAIHQRIQQRRAASAIQSGRLIPSSWIFGLSRDLQGYVYMDTPGQLYKSQKIIPLDIFNDWKRGAATCITTDTGLIKRWWRGKTPSLGAYYNKNIRGKYKFDKL